MGQKTPAGKRISMFVLAAALTGLVIAVPAYAQKVADYTADQVVTGPKGKVEQESKVTVSGDRIRLDRVKPADPKMSYIFRRDAKQTVTINASKKIYFEGPLEEKAFAEAFGLPLTVKAERAAGEEAVSGFPAAKKEVDQEIEFKKAKKTVTSTVWSSDRLNLPLRVKTAENLVIELKNIKEGKPDASLFDAPKDFKKAAALKDVLPSDPFLDDED
jgi:outer membrane lipoprotein-sorting protein